MWKRATIPYFPPFLIHGTWWENGKGFHSGGGGGGFSHGFHVESTGKCGRIFFALASANYLFLSPTAPFLSIAKERGGKNARKNCVFAFPQRAMGCGNLMLRSARLRKSSFFVPSKDCLSNSAAAADTHTKQRFLFYRRSA